MLRLSKMPSWLTMHLKRSGHWPAIQFIMIAAVGRAQRADVVAVEPRVSLERRLESEF